MIILQTTNLVWKNLLLLEKGNQAIKDNKPPLLLKTSLILNLRPNPKRQIV